jgi:hypothetical protein
MKLSRMLVMGGVAALCLGAVNIFAQDTNSTSNNDNQGQGRRGGRGNFDPAEFQQRMMDNVKDRLAFTNDTEWAAVQPLVQKVFDTRRDVGFAGMNMLRAGRGGNGGGGDDQRQRRNAFNQPTPEADSLQKALDDKAPAAQVKAALEKYRSVHKDKQAKLEAAQEDLRKVLTSRQEAQAVLLGLLN